MSVEKKRIFVERESSTQKTSISWWNASYSFWSVRRNLWRSLSESIGVCMTSLVQTTKTKSLLKMRGLRSIKKWALKRIRSFLISYVEWNLNEELARYFTNASVLSDRKGHPTSKSMRFIIKRCRSKKPSNVFITVILKLENAMRPSGVPYHLLLNKRVIRI